MFLEEEQQSTQINLGYRVRPPFRAFHARTKKRAVLVCHRRAGKTEAALYDLVDKALRIKWRETRPGAPPLFGYVAPYKSQARDVIWRRLLVVVKKIPGAVVKESRLEVELPNGALLKLYGADSEDIVRGQYFDGIILDECGDIKSEFWKTIHYGLNDYDGWAVFMGTPKGKNSFWRRLQQAIKNPDKWYHMVLKASESKILTAKDIESITEECDDDADMLAQELECSFEAAIKGSYFGKHVQALQDRVPSPIKYGAAAKALFNPNVPVSLAFDIGTRDAMAIWFWQVWGGSCKFIRYFEQTGWDADDAIEYLQNLPYSYKTVWMPHDAAHETFRSKKSVIDVFSEAGLPMRPVVDPDRGQKIFHGYNAVRKVLKTYPVEFDGDECKRGLDCLKHYSHKWDSKNNVFVDEAKHDEWSHGADGFRYAALSISLEEIHNSFETSNVVSIASASINRAIRMNDEVTYGDLTERHLRQVAARRSSPQRW